MEQPTLQKDIENLRSKQLGLLPSNAQIGSIETDATILETPEKALQAIRDLVIASKNVPNPVGWVCYSTPDDSRIALLPKELEEIPDYAWLLNAELCASDTTSYHLTMVTAEQWILTTLTQKTPENTTDVLFEEVMAVAPGQFPEDFKSTQCRYQIHWSPSLHPITGIEQLTPQSYRFLGFQ